MYLIRRHYTTTRPKIEKTALKCTTNTSANIFLHIGTKTIIEH